MPALLTIKEAAQFATEYTKRNVTPSNISYLINYGRISKVGDNGTSLVDREELTKYYGAFLGQREAQWKGQLGADLNWALSFDTLKEAETTKHVHRLHPYKGKFIPQLVEYILDSHTDEFKQQVFFKPGDIILDPFCGSGTTLIQANELGLHAVGIDISAFNTLISNVKIQAADLPELYSTLKNITFALRNYVQDAQHLAFEARLLAELSSYNNRFFPSPEFKIKARKKEINELEYAAYHEKETQQIFQSLVAEFGLKVKQDGDARFLDKWYLQPVRDEIDFVFAEIEQIANQHLKKIATLILSRTIRSCRATTHADLATLLEPVTEPYYCAKHGKICKPLFSILSWWERYCQDTIKRFAEFDKLRTATHQICLHGNSAKIDILAELAKENRDLCELAKTQKIRGIFSSPPYVGLIDYHEQHAYAYDLFGFARKDEEEIGPLSKKQGKAAQQNYAAGISSVLHNAAQFLVDDYDVFLVANDKYGLYPQIAENAGMQIVNQYKRPVLNRTERDKQAYAETIFHLKQR